MGFVLNVKLGRRVIGLNYLGSRVKTGDLESSDKLKSAFIKINENIYSNIYSANRRCLQSPTHNKKRFAGSFN